MRPRNMNAFHPMFRVTYSRDIGSNQTMMLEEVQMLPLKLFEVMRLAGFPTLRTRKQRTPIRSKLKGQLMGFLLCIEMLQDHFPRRGQS